VKSKPAATWEALPKGLPPLSPVDRYAEATSAYVNPEGRACRVRFSALGDAVWFGRLHGVRGFSPAFRAGLQSPVKRNGRSNVERRPRQAGPSEKSFGGARSSCPGQRNSPQMDAVERLFLLHGLKDPLPPGRNSVSVRINATVVKAKAFTEKRR